MDVDALLTAATDTANVKRVFGEPIERDGTLIIPVAVVAGGGGGGGRDSQPDQPGEGGGGFWTWAHPMGVYVARDGRVDFRPAIDVTALALCATLLLPRLLRALRRRHR
jgi:uncharacterized spore protein YtfJ